MGQNKIIGYLKSNVKLVIFFVVFAVVQFYFFWGLCHLMPGERFYQRRARIMSGTPALPVVFDSRKKSQIPNFETDQSHIQQIHDELRREGQLPQSPALK
jgi:hypothetical protein